jgi:Xaa-Pro dipeptidase
VSSAGGSRREARIRQWAQDHDVDVVMCAEPAEILALSGFDPVGTFYLTAVLIPRADAAQLFTFRAEADMARHQSWLRDVLFWSHGENAVGRLADAIRAAARPVAGGRAVRVAVALDGWLPVSKLRELAACDGLELVAADHEVQDAAVVSAGERREVLRRAAAASNAAIAAGCSAVRDGALETEIAAAMVGAYRAAGGDEPGRPISVASGPRTALAHAIPAPRRVMAGEQVALRCWGTFQRSAAPAGRTVVALGAAAPAGATRAGDVLDIALAAGVEALRSECVAAHDVAQAMLAVITGSSASLAAAAQARQLPVGEVVGLSYPRHPSRFALRLGQPEPIRPGDVIVLAPAFPGATDGWARGCVTYAVTETGPEALAGLPGRDLAGAAP